MSFFRRKTMLNACIVFLLSSVVFSHGFAQKPGRSPVKGADMKISDSTKPGSPAGKVVIKPYKDVITKTAVSTKGIFTVHKVEEKIYFEIPFSVMNKDMLIVNRLASASDGMRSGMRSTIGYAGDPIGSGVIKFERGPNNKIFVRRISFTEYSKDSTSPMYAAVTRNTVPPIIAAFPIAAIGPDSSSLVLDMTDYLNTDNELFGFSDQVSKMMYHIGAPLNDRCYTEYVHTYPQNLEVRTVKSYSANGTMVSGNYTFSINSSLVLLPEKPMKPRYYDERVGYFTTDFMDYDANPQGVKQQSLVDRWRLEPKPEDVEKYKRGELVEPQKPIVFYIDPATPKKWAPYLIQGVNDWNKVFEQAGFKNAVMARPAPTKEEDSTFSLEDARHSAIIYKPSPVANASGPHISDPRTGEILESHINWYHNVMNLIHNWYMIQCGAVDPRARKMEFDDSLMGQLIRFVCSHEVGHTFGLRHNFGASSSVPVDSLRSNKWLAINGHTPSIMDYARFNYVAQPEDSIVEAGLFPRIGDYDKWAIEWGYKWYDTPAGEDDIPVLSKLTTEKLKNPRLWFGTEQNPVDPRSQNEDLGDDAMKAGVYGIKNLQRILPQLPAWTQKTNEGYDNLASAYKMLNTQLDRYLVHVIKNITGVYETPKNIEQAGPVYTLVPKNKQKAAMAFLDRYAFQTPTWLYDRDIFDKTGQNFTSLIIDRQGGLINTLVGTYRMSRMLDLEATYGKQVVYTLQEFLDDMDHDILKELYSGKAVDIYRRNLQKIYIDKLLSIAYPPSDMFSRPSDGPNGPASTYASEMLPAKYTDMSSTIKSQLKRELKLFKNSLLLVKDQPTVSHIQDMVERLNKAIKNDK